MEKKWTNALSAEDVSQCEVNMVCDIARQYPFTLAEAYRWHAREMVPKGEGVAARFRSTMEGRIIPDKLYLLYQQIQTLCLYNYMQWFMLADYKKTLDEMRRDMDVLQTELERVKRKDSAGSGSDEG